MSEQPGSLPSYFQVCIFHFSFLKPIVVLFFLFFSLFTSFTILHIPSVPPSIFYYPPTVHDPAIIGHTLVTITLLKRREFAIAAFVVSSAAVRHLSHIIPSFFPTCFAVVDTSHKLLKSDMTKQRRWPVYRWDNPPFVTKPSNP